ncbi:SDR family oxidoreductase [Aquincola sp. S2]|uniref:SDR family oxidoreductase n=1 Tax=Pseudaquabacterium terrae TaxID=2732868 RepID=A0ABX2EHZ2_9BURK|nr:SDR family oxidoreductase [Aquabacterium terrae]NRF68199.1 SDR family oxidoreductase [Aquabacterium terrae]
MRILLTGATGFIGSRLLAALQLRGHEVWCAGRRAPPLTIGFLPIDFSRALAKDDWLPLVRDADVVINTVGLFREHGTQSFERLHEQAPCALFDACVEAGVPRVVQLSALGVERRRSAYQRSKHTADAYLLALPLDGIVVQPSLVFGADGASSARLLTLAAMPLLPLPAGGGQPVQPVHVDDVVEALCALVEAPAVPGAGRTVPLVGPRPLSLRRYLLMLRGALGLKPTLALRVPAWLVTLAACWGEVRGQALLDRGAWTMLQQGSVGPAVAIHWLLGQPPREAGDFLIGEPLAALRLQARLGWLLPLLRLALAMVWIVTGLLSLGLFPRDESYALLADTGIATAVQPLLLFGAAGLDLAFGLATLWPPNSARWRARLWLAQMAFIGSTMLIIAMRLPAFLLHPFGPLLKNLPMLAILVLLYLHERDSGAPTGRAAPA